MLPLKFSGTDSLGCWNGMSAGHQDGASPFQLDKKILLPKVEIFT